MFPGSNVNGSVTWSSRNDRTIEEMTPLRWKLSFVDLLRCPDGIKFFQKFLESEYSGENLKFWIAVKKYKSSPVSRYHILAKAIYDKHLADDCAEPVNLPQSDHKEIIDKIEDPGYTPSRFLFEDAAA